MISKISKTAVPIRKNDKKENVISKSLIKKTVYKIPNQGKMCMKNKAKGESYSGHNSDTLIKVLTYYLSNNITNKALISATEGYRFNELTVLSKYYKYENANSVVTTFYNQLALFAVKYVNIVNYPLVLTVCNMVKNKDRDYNNYITMVYLLSETFKSNIALYLDYTFMESHGREMAKDYFIKLDIDDDYAVNKLEDEDAYGKFILELNDKKIYDENLIRNLLIFRIALINRNINEAFNSLYEISKLFKTNDNNKTLILNHKIKLYTIKSKNETTNNAYVLLWRALEDLMTQEAYEILIKLYFISSKNNKKYFLYTAILAAINDNDSKCLDLSKYSETCCKYSNELLNGVYTLDISDYEENLKEYEQAEDDKFIVDIKDTPKEHKYRSKKNLLPLAENFENIYLKTVYFDIPDEKRRKIEKITIIEN